MLCQIVGHRIVLVTCKLRTRHAPPGHPCCRDADAIDSLDRFAMACPALPLCGLAIGEAERGLPDINNRIRALMNKLGFGADEHFHIRMTGCPNGCTRPYMAELGFVGDGPNSYQLWLGGTASQTRLAEPFMERMKVQVRLINTCSSRWSTQQPFSTVSCQYCVSSALSVLPVGRYFQLQPCSVHGVLCSSRRSPCLQTAL